MHKKYITINYILITLLFVSNSYGYDTNQGFKDGIKAAKQFKNQSYLAVQNFKPEKFIKNYSDHPKEEDYLTHQEAIKEDAVKTRESSTIGKSISQGISERAEKFHYRIEPNSPNMQHIGDKADTIYKIITGQFGDCTKENRCTIKYENKVCEETPKSQYQYCRNLLHVDLIPREVKTHYLLTAHVRTHDHDYAGVVYNTVNGNIVDLGPREARASLSGRIPNTINCHSLQGSISKINSRNPNTYIDNISYPSCNNGLALTLHLSNKERQGIVSIDIDIDMVSTQIVYEQQDRWDDNCIGIDNSKLCQLQEEHCVSAQSTRVIQGIPITRACWEKEKTYRCGAEEEKSTCDAYRNQGCEQIGSICKLKNDGGCGLYQESFQCPLKECTDVGMICNGQTYCLDGSCIDQQKQADPDFQKSVTELSAVSEAAKEYGLHQNDQFPIFSGVVKTCNKDFLDFADCCKEEGWGVDLNLAQCEQEAKALGEAKQKGLTVYIDSDEDCTLGLCSHRKRYCVFPSKLARIIQEKGRRDQLHVAFGNFHHPDCRGVTPNEFSSLNLSVIDFTEIVSDVTSKKQFAKEDSTQALASQKVSQWSQEKKYHE